MIMPILDGLSSTGYSIYRSQSCNRHQLWSLWLHPFQRGNVTKFNKLGWFGALWSLLRRTELLYQRSEYVYHVDAR